MTATIARLILAMLLLPATGAVFLVSFVVLVQVSPGPTKAQLVTLWLIVYLFVGCYWILLWRRQVKWTAARKGLTVAASVLALVGGAGVGMICLAFSPGVPIEISLLIGGGTVPIIWVLETVLIWRETAQERVERLTALGAPIVCPICGYNLAGLREARCPECGASFTLDQLVSAQPEIPSKKSEL